MHKTTYFLWSAIAIILYVLGNALALQYFSNEIMGAINNIDWLTLFVLALGIYRLTDIVLYEKVAEPVRAVFVQEHLDSKGSHSLQKFFNQLFSCNSCLGVWVATVVVYFYIWQPSFTFVFMLIMALTGLERFFSKICNFLERK